MKWEPFRVAATFIILISFGAGCVTEARLPAPPEWPAKWSERQIFNTQGAVIYARDSSAADQAAHAAADVEREFNQRTGAKAPRGLVIVDDVEDSQLGDLPPEELLPPGKKNDTDLLEMGFTKKEIALAATMNIPNDQLTGKIGFTSQAAGTVSWAIAVPSDRRIDQFIHHTMDAGMTKAKVNFAERVLFLPFMPVLSGMMSKMLSAQRDIVIYERLCEAQSTWDEARRKKEAHDYAAQKMKSLQKSMGAATQEEGTGSATRQATTRQVTTRSAMTQPAK